MNAVMRLLSGLASAGQAAKEIQHSSTAELCVLCGETRARADLPTCEACTHKALHGAAELASRLLSKKSPP